jgi:hypothetical protein
VYRHVYRASRDFAGFWEQRRSPRNFEVAVLLYYQTPAEFARGNSHSKPTRKVRISYDLPCGFRGQTTSILLAFPLG